MGSWKVSAGRRIMELGAVLVVVLLIVAVLRPNLYVPRDSARVAETKQNLHIIQCAAERYARDHGETYPPYLIGGAAKYAAHFDELGGAKAFDDPQPCADIAQVADPLLREGYLDVYPRNPFVRGDPKPFDVHKAQLRDPYWPAGGDPLRNGNADAQRLGTRFGADCTKMGQVLGDPRYQLAGVPGAPVSAEACAGVMYPYWDIWVGRKPKPFLPGEFYYRSAGTTAMPDPATIPFDAPAEGSALSSYRADSYVLGVYGGRRSKGMDMLDSFGNPYWIPPAAGTYAKKHAQTKPVIPPRNGIADAVICIFEAGVNVNRK